jgi:hypothetical protein
VRSGPKPGADIIHVVIVTLTQTPVRRVVRATALVAATAAVGLVASPASAKVPEGWSEPEPVDTLQAILLLVGAPLALFLVIALAVYVPALARGEKVAPGEQVPDSTWFGGPRQGVQAADKVAAAELEGARGEGAGTDQESGGASGRW